MHRALVDRDAVDWANESQKTLGKSETRTTIPPVAPGPNRKILSRNPFVFGKNCFTSTRLSM